MENVINYSW